MAEANLFVRITGSGKELINEFQKVQKEADKSGAKMDDAGKRTASGWQKASAGIKMAGAAIAGTALAVGVASIEMADKYEASHARLETALKNTGSSWENQKRQIGAVTDAAVKFGYTKTDVEGALAGMVTGMGSSAKAVKAFQLAEDLAAAKGIDLATAGMLVTKASEGQIKPLKALGIDLPVAAGGALKVKKANDALTLASQNLKEVQDKIHAGMLSGPAAADALSAANLKVKDAQDKVNTTQATGATILDALGKKLGGSAAAQSETFAGKTKALKASIDNVAITIGMALMPILIKMADFLEKKVIPFFQKHSVYAKILAGVLAGVLVAAIVLYTVSMVSAAAATIAATWPILVVIAAVAALAAGIIFAWTHWNQIWNWIAHHKAYAILIAVIFPIVPLILGLVAAAKFVADHWTGIWGTISAIVSGASRVIMDVLNPMLTVLNDIVGAAEAVGRAFDKIHTPSSILGHKIPHFAKGGVVPGAKGAPMLAVVHGGEQVISNDQQSSFGGSTFAPPAAQGGNVTVNVALSGHVVGTTRQLGQFISDALISYERGTGKRWLAQ